MKTWEDSISLRPSSDKIGLRLQSISAYANMPRMDRFANLEITKAINNDRYPLPSKEAREGYYGDSHLNYWLSGLKDSNDIVKYYLAEVGDTPKSYLDFGGASGRVARHMALQHEIPDVWIADINREHVNFVLEVFLGRVKAFQSTSIPHLPLEDNSLDFISAFSVFSHIETFDETWLLELRRILKPGGMLMVTANVDTFQDVKDGWPVYKALANHPNFDASTFGRPINEPRLVVRWNADGSYSSVVFLRSDYVKARWEPLFSSMQIIPYLTQYQAGVAFIK